MSIEDKLPRPGDSPRPEESVATAATESPEEDASPVAAPAAKRGWLRRVVQFRLRTLMLMTVVAAIATQWWLRPQPEERKFGDYRVFSHVKMVKPKNSNGGLAVSASGEYEVRDGAYWINDLDGRVLLRGAFDEDTPVGRWRAYYPNGRLASSGRCDERGGRTGVWKSWHPNGQLKQKIKYGESHEFGDEMLYASTRISVRQGEAEAWYDGGKQRWQGQFQDDQLHGKWSFHLPNGDLQAEGSYRAGQRHGPWRIRRTNGDGIQETYYLAGEPSEDPAARSDEELREMLASSVQRRQLEGLKLAYFSNRPLLLWEAAQQADRPLALAALTRLARLGETPAPLAEQLQEFAASQQNASRPDSRLRAAALAACFALIPDAREDMLRKITAADVAPQRRRELAAALARQGAVGADHWGQMLKSQREAEGRFAFQALLWKWSELHRGYGVIDPQPGTQAQQSLDILRSAVEDEQVPEAVREMIKQWSEATFGGKGGFNQGMFGGGSFF